MCRRFRLLRIFTRWRPAKVLVEERLRPTVTEWISLLETLATCDEVGEKPTTPFVYARCQPELDRYLGGRKSLS